MQRIFIPTHDRPEGIKKTLEFITNSNFDGEINLCLSPGQEKDYFYLKDEYGVKLIKTDAHNVIEKFNFIHDAVVEGGEAFVIEDDVVIIGKDRKPVKDLKNLIKEGFDSLKGAGLFGLSPHSNPFYMSGKITRTLKLTVAHAFGFVKEDDDWLKVTQIAKSDYERTCRYFLKYGEIVRLDFYGVKTVSYTAKGGMQSDMDYSEINQKERDAVDYLCETFPMLLKENKKKKSLHPELSFKRCKLPDFQLRMLMNGIKIKGHQ